jgi:hypothetical protein
MAGAALTLVLESVSEATPAPCVNDSDHPWTITLVSKPNPGRGPSKELPVMDEQGHVSGFFGTILVLDLKDKVLADLTKTSTFTLKAKTSYRIDYQDQPNSSCLAGHVGEYYILRNQTWGRRRGRILGLRHDGGGTERVPREFFMSLL